MLVGNLMGDFVKGNKFDYLPSDLVKGIYQHRAIDKFTDQHPLIHELKHCLSPARKRFFGIVIDVAFDHFLAKSFQQWANVPLAEFSQSICPLLLTHKTLMPERMQTVVTHMARDNWLESYQQTSAMQAAINGISRRIRFENKLAGAGEEVVANYQKFEQVFNLFMPQLIAFANTSIGNKQRLPYIK